MIVEAFTTLHITQGYSKYFEKSLILLFRVSQFSVWIAKMVGKEKSKLCWDKQFSAQWKKKVLNPTPGASNVFTQDASDSNAPSSRITTQDTSQNPADGPQPYTMPPPDIIEPPSIYTMPPEPLAPAPYTMPTSESPPDKTDTPSMPLHEV